MEVLKNAVVCDQLADRVICNICGHEIPKDRFGYFQDYVHIDKTWGYNSDKDGENVCIDICQDCFDKIISSCKLKP